MTKTTYAGMKLKINTQSKEIDFNGNKIEVLQYLPIEDKYDLVMITLQRCYEDGIYNPIKKDIYFHLFLVYMYTDIVFTEKQKENELKIYDTLESNGLMAEIIKAIPEEEYNLLFNYINEVIENKMYWNTSASAIANKIINDLPSNMQAAVDALNNFDQDKFKAVQSFAKAANGGRDIQ